MTFAQAGAGGAGSISSGSDVALNNPVNNHVLAFDATVSKWKNTPTPLTGLTKASVGLTNVDDTSDVSKPISSAQQVALNEKAPQAQAVGVVTHGANSAALRPSGWASIMWIGSVAPANAANNTDTWLDTSS